MSPSIGSFEIGRIMGKFMGGKMVKVLYSQVMIWKIN
jgi:hypothetical protein